MKPHVIYETDWEGIPESTKERLIVSGVEAIDYMISDGEKALEENESLLAYAVVSRSDFDSDLRTYLSDNGFEFPEEGKTELYVVLKDEQPASTMWGEVRLADLDKCVKDYRTGNVRLFTSHFKHNTQFREFLLENLSDEYRQELEEKYAEMLQELEEEPPKKPGQPRRDILDPFRKDREEDDREEQDP